MRAVIAKTEIGVAFLRLLSQCEHLRRGERRGYRGYGRQCLYSNSRQATVRIIRDNLNGNKCVAVSGSKYEQDSDIKNTADSAIWHLSYDLSENIEETEDRRDTSVLPVLLGDVSPTGEKIVGVGTC